MEILIVDPNELGKVIRARRKKVGLTQEKVASLAGIGTRFLSELERGKPTVQLGKTLKIIRILGLEVHIHQRK